MKKTKNLKKPINSYSQSYPQFTQEKIIILQKSYKSRHKYMIIWQKNYKQQTELPKNYKNITKA